MKGFMMLVNSIPQYQSNCTFRAEVKPEVMKKRCEKLTQQYIMSPKHIIKWPENQSEKNAVADTLKNIYRILLSQDIWSTSLKVKWPETPEEKAALLEILGFRAQLDKFTQLSHRKFEVMHDESESMTPETRRTTLNAIEKKIDEEKKRYKGAFEFFRELGEMEDMYIDNKYVKTKGMNDFWDQIRANNVNKDRNMSAQELINLIENNEKPLSKEELRLQREEQMNNLKSQIAEQYRNTLLQIINIYADHTSHYTDAVRARNEVIKNHEEALKQFPEIEGDLMKIYEEAEQSIINKVNRLVDVRRKVDGKWVTGIDIHPIGEYQKIMDKKVKEIKDAQQETENIRLKLQKTPNSSSLKKELQRQSDIINEAKEYWLGVLEFSVEKEYANREIFDSVGRLSEYEELTDQNRTILRHRELLDIAKKNGDSLPEEIWNEILA